MLRTRNFEFSSELLLRSIAASSVLDCTDISQVKRLLQQLEVVILLTISLSCD